MTTKRTGIMELSAHQQRAIHQRARQFAEKWGGKANLRESEHSESFMDDFFGIFDIDYYIRNIISEYILPSKQRIDVFWPGVILIENKSSRNSSLHKAFIQAREYYKELEGYYKPKYILVNNFHTFEIYSFRKNHFLRIKALVLIPSQQVRLKAVSKQTAAKQIIPCNPMLAIFSSHAKLTTWTITFP